MIPVAKPASANQKKVTSIKAGTAAIEAFTINDTILKKGMLIPVTTTLSDSTVFFVLNIVFIFRSPLKVLNLFWQY